MKSYKYVGPPDLLKLANDSPTRQLIENQTDVLAWIERTTQVLSPNLEVTATFIVDTQTRLWIADRRSEHVACARGGPVLSAGEITFALESENGEVVAITNQSTGFCPEPKSWASVSRALDSMGLKHPGAWTTEFQFRRCENCGAINLVKDEWFVCAVCDAELSAEWNF